MFIKLGLKQYILFDGQERKNCVRQRGVKGKEAGHLALWAGLIKALDSSTKQVEFRSFRVTLGFSKLLSEGCQEIELFGNTVK